MFLFCGLVFFYYYLFVGLIFYFYFFFNKNIVLYEIHLVGQQKFQVLDL